MAAAGAVSFGMVGVFALPAYATPETEGLPDGFARGVPQTLLTTQAEELELHSDVAPVEVDEVIAEREQEAEEAAELEAEAEAAAQEADEAGDTAADESGTAEPGEDIPAGKGAQGIVDAARAQLGVFQDCTALVEKSLRAVGIPAGDLGTQVHEYTALGGTVVTSGSYAPGDILIWAGRHVAVYIGNGQAVHGGFGGNQTVIASAFIDGQPSAVVRFG
ncbi:C40 family peptidase [Leucobacter weissii]|uniref:C40 family peptidase n=1 Tax=Leucobacter weissii TaxID=1983706 RepID=A0A939SAN6_9MICO|nr:NlpC/P60 family protein [Leucobacter weissii]MBO1900655.1 C40 family peptidase [Leucobacter weissii]